MLGKKDPWHKSSTGMMLEGPGGRKGPAWVLSDGDWMPGSVCLDELVERVRGQWVVRHMSTRGIMDGVPLFVAFPRRTRRPLRPSRMYICSHCVERMGCPTVGINP